ncbi:MAG: sigma-70 family RNA polymerase sigma factor [Clostridiales bacterium]|nr:sigma-70 family RNA polymerase sigma factor [Clostridiales bacterium]
MYELNAKKSDEELVTLSQNGDKQATEILMLRHAGLVRGCARGFFLIGGETEDLIQEGMIGLYNAIGEYRQGERNSNFKNFAYLCVSRRIIDAVKASARKKNSPLNTATSIVAEAEVLTGGLNPEDMLILQDDRREFRQKMSGVLSDFEFKVTTMYMDGMSCAEICEATGKSGKSVDNALQRSKRKLQEVLR